MPTQRFLLCCLLSAVCLFTIGCQPGNTSQDTLIEDTFPAQMVGVWANEQHGWILRIEEDGRLSKLRHTIGRVDLAAGQRAEFPLIDDGKGFMQPGPWQVEYLAETGDLVIDISLEGFEYILPYQGVISGSSRDIFIGKLPNIGEKTWTAQWISKPDFVASTEDKTYTDYKLPFKAGDEDKGEIIFEKVDPGSVER